MAEVEVLDRLEGAWAIDGSLDGGRVWEAPEAVWVTELGTSKLLWSYGVLQSVSHALFLDRDGQYFVDVKSTQGQIPGFRYYVRDEDGICRYGSIYSISEPGECVGFRAAQQQPSPHGAWLTHQSPLLEELRNSFGFLASLKFDIAFARDVYRALAGVRWCSQRRQAISSFKIRQAAAIVCALRGFQEPYLEFFLCGDEGRVSDQVGLSFKSMGWEPAEIS